MTAITRRGLLASAAAAGVAGAVAPTMLATPARAAAPTAGKQAPGIYRYTVGDFECTAINDGVWRPELKEGFIKNVPLADVQEAMKAAFKSTDFVEVPFTTLLVNTGRSMVLIDSGTGGQLAPTAGTLHDNLAAAGIDADKIDTILVSHFHPDHVFGLKSKQNEYVFKNAEIVVPESEWAFWMAQDTINKMPENRRGVVKRVQDIFGPIAKDVRRIGNDVEAVPGIRSIATPGHTPGHTSYHIASGSEEMIALGDVTNVPFLFVRHPGWHAGFDMDGDLAEDSRRRIFDRVSADRTLVAGYHFPFPAAGHIAKAGDGYELVPVAWTTQL